MRYVSNTRVFAFQQPLKEILQYQLDNHQNIKDNKKKKKLLEVHDGLQRRENGDQI